MIDTPKRFFFTTLVLIFILTQINTAHMYPPSSPKNWEYYPGFTQGQRFVWNVTEYVYQDEPVFSDDIEKHGLQQGGKISMLIKKSFSGVINYDSDLESVYDCYELYVDEKEYDRYYETNPYPSPRTISFSLRVVGDGGIGVELLFPTKANDRRWDLLTWLNDYFDATWTESDGYITDGTRTYDANSGILTEVYWPSQWATFRYTLLNTSLLDDFEDLTFDDESDTLLLHVDITSISVLFIIPMLNLLIKRKNSIQHNVIE